MTASPRCALGLDLGTSGLKAVLLGEDGRTIAVATSTYEVVVARPGWAETDPAHWEAAARDAVAQVMRKAPEADVVGIGIDGQMHGLVVIDSQGTPLRRAVLWPDARAVEEAGAFQRLDCRTLAELANPINPGMAGPIAAWLVIHEPDLMARAHLMLSPKDWLRSRLIQGSFVTDASDASATLMWNARNSSWDDDVVAAIGIRPELLPQPIASGGIAGRIEPAVARSWGVPSGIPVSVGCADVPATILGMPALTSRYTIIVGTGAQIILPGIEPDFSSSIDHHIYRTADDSHYAMAAVMNAGLALQRVVETLDASWRDLYRPRGNESRIPGFLPYFSGERLPRQVAAGNGGWFGLALETDRPAMLYAAIEGVAFAIRHAGENMPAAEELTADLVGGGAREPVFCQLMADVLGRPLRRLIRENATSIGAAQLGWEVARGARLELAELGDRVFEPRADAGSEERYRRFLDATERLTTRSAHERT